MVENIEASKSEVILLDGFPRNILQAEKLYEKVIILSIFNVKKYNFRFSYSTNRKLYF